jgi:hypothetical protein
MLTVRKLRYFTSAAAASLVLVAATGDNFADQVSSTSEFVHTAQVTNGGVIGGNGGVTNNGGVIGGGTNGGNGGVTNNGGVINGSVSGGGGTTNSPGALRSGSTYKPR